MTDDTKLPQPKRSRCRTCGAEIFWALSPRGQKTPIDYEPSTYSVGITNFAIERYDDAGTPQLRQAGMKEPVYHSHFGTCPYGRAHSLRTRAIDAQKDRND